MNNVELESLDDLINSVTELRQKIKDSKRHEHQVLPKPLFRGQSNSNWELDTTLERYTDKVYLVNYYDTTLSIIYPAVASFTDKEWPMNHEQQSSDRFSHPPNYEFMVYARHHGFPSPLLDWSQSLYVALFFAFQNAKPDENVAIFVYIETMGGGKVGWVGSPQINKLNSYIKTHQRHFSQQGQYTVAVKQENDNWVYCHHNEGFAQSDGSKQDILYKYILPGSLKESILERLNEMNINAFTLYSSEESLMETLAFKEIALRNL